MSWPTPQDYNEAIQSPSFCFDDSELKRGIPELTNLGLPKPITGGFASVYKIKCDTKNWAIRCFLREFIDQQERYDFISQHLEKLKLPYTVSFKFLSKGIKVKGKWYPILKMEWVQGESLNIYIQKNLNNQSVLIKLAEQWETMIKTLQDSNIAHGDLQHGNVLVMNNNIKLIDYDGMFVPTLKGKSSNEVGHRNYQHPSRNEFDFDLYIDNFSAWVIYISIIAFASDASLWDKTNAGDENLLFRKEDFENPSSSLALNSLLLLNNEIKNYATVIQSFIYMVLPQIPLLDSSKFNENIFVTPRIINNINSNNKFWLEDHISQNNQQSINKINNVDSSWIFEHIEMKKIDSLTASYNHERISLITSTILLGICIFLIYSQLFIYFVYILSICILIINLLFLQSKYKSIPEVKDKIKVLIDLKEIKSEISAIELSITQLNNEKNKLENEEKNKNKQISDKKDNLFKNEKTELNKIDSNLQKELSRIDSEKRNLSNEKDKEINRALKNIQSQYQRTQLSQYTIANGNISGIGSELTRRLASHGITNASHITSLHSVTRVNGIGEKKGSALYYWRQGVDVRIARNMPQTISNYDKSSIEAKYIIKSKDLDSHEVKAKMKAKQDKDTLISDNPKQQILLDNQLQENKVDYSKKYSEINKKINNDKKLLYDKKSFNLIRIEREFDEYNKINYSLYFKNIFNIGITKKNDEI